MKKKLRTYIDTARLNCVRATPASVFVGGVALLMTSFCYWIYFQIFLFAHDLFPVPHSLLTSLTDDWRDWWIVMVRLTFELLALGVLWRYLTPSKVYRYWQAHMSELPAFLPQTWKQLATIVFGLSLSFGAAIGFLAAYHYKLKPAQHSNRSSDDLTMKAFEDFAAYKNRMKKKGVIISSPPCYEDGELEWAGTPQD